eukprot:1161802-Pelagomonas_calceolata.AAC.20
MVLSEHSLQAQQACSKNTQQANSARTLSKQTQQELCKHTQQSERLPSKHLLKALSKHSLELSPRSSIGSALLMASVSSSLDRNSGPAVHMQGCQVAPLTPFRLAWKGVWDDSKTNKLRN